MAHDRVVDTSFLFEGSDKKFSTPSLKDVVKAALGRDIQGGSHDSVTDAKVRVVCVRKRRGRRGRGWSKLFS